MEQKTHSHSKAKVAIYCGSSVGKNPRYTDEATKVANLLLSLEMGLVYGGGSIGIMGVLADTIFEQHGYVHGIIPKFLFEREVAFHNCTELTITESMHERKAIIADVSDIFMALPGGFGTLDELMEIVTWKQLGLHSKPIVVYNPFGFYDELLVTIKKLTEEGFIHPDNLSLFKVISSEQELKSFFLDYLSQEHQPSTFIKQRS